MGVLGKSETGNILVKNDRPLWLDGSPILVIEANILDGNSDATLQSKIQNMLENANILDGTPENLCASLQFKIQNLSLQPVVAIYFTVRCFNLLYQELATLERQAIQDICIQSGATCLIDRTYPLPDYDTRRVEIIIHNVILADGSVWGNETNAVLKPLPNPERLELQGELVFEMCRLRDSMRDYKPFYGDYPNLYRYAPDDNEQFWSCACGQINIADRCVRCNLLKTTVFEITQPDILLESRKKYLEIEQKKREQRSIFIRKMFEKISNKFITILKQVFDSIKRWLSFLKSNHFR